jgi:hypothetical protein
VRAVSDLSSAVGGAWWKEALLFEKRSKNFCYLGRAVRRCAFLECLAYRVVLARAAVGVARLCAGNKLVHGSCSPPVLNILISGGTEREDPS